MKHVNLFESNVKASQFWTLQKWIGTLFSLHFFSWTEWAKRAKTDFCGEMRAVYVFCVPISGFIFVIWIDRKFFARVPYEKHSSAHSVSPWALLIWPWPTVGTWFWCHSNLSKHTERKSSDQQLMFTLFPLQCSLQENQQWLCCVPVAPVGHTKHFRRKSTALWLCSLGFWLSCAWVKTVVNETHIYHSLQKRETPGEGIMLWVL